MIKPTVGIALLIVVTSLALGSAPDQRTVVATCTVPYVDPHDLRGIPAVHLDVDGFPTAFPGSAVSEMSLTAQVKKQLLEAGLESSTDYLADAPTLHIRVLPVQGTAQGFFIITAELEENCRVPRAGGANIAACTTWSVYPRLGFFDRGDVSILEIQVADVVKQFASTWSSDNRTVRSK